MPDILFITPGPIEWASSRMRAHWIAEHIGADVVEYDNLAQHPISNYSTVIFVKVANANLAEDLRKHNMKVYWDICDPVHWYQPAEARKMADAVDGIVASNQGLADDFERWSRHKVQVIKDRVNLEHFTPRQTISTDYPIRFIWYGASQNRFTIHAAFPYLERLAANGVQIELTICDDRPHEAWRCENFPIYHTRWALESESQIITSHDIAILPPHPGPWGRVKSNNKFVTACACGVTPTDGENYDQLRKLALDPNYRRNQALLGLKWVREKYDVRQSVQEWLDLVGN